MSTPDQVSGINPSGEYSRRAGADLNSDSVIKTDRVDLSRPITVIDRPRGRLLVRADVIISDHDETISIGTGEHVHDGHLARFAQGLSSTLVDYQNSSGLSFLDPEHTERYGRTNSIFSPKEWETFKGQSGKSEIEVLRGMLRVAFERFPIPEDEFDSLLRQFGDNANRVLAHGFLKFMENVKIDPGMERVIGNALNAAIPVAVVSASQRRVVLETLSHFGIRIKEKAGEGLSIDVVIGNAVKKVNDTTFCGKSIMAACNELQVHPNQAVMFGDSIGDVAAAARAGIKTILICPRSDKDREGLKKQIENFQIQPEYNEELLRAGGGIKVYLVSEFDQVDIQGRIQAEARQATCVQDISRAKKEA